MYVIFITIRSSKTFQFNTGMMLNWCGCKNVDHLDLHFIGHNNKSKLRTK